MYVCIYIYNTCTLLFDNKDFKVDAYLDASDNIISPAWMSIKCIETLLGML